MDCEIGMKPDTCSGNVVSARPGLFSLLLLFVLSPPAVVAGQSFEQRVEDIVSRTWLKAGPFRKIGRAHV